MTASYISRAALIVEACEYQEEEDVVMYDAGETRLVCVVVAQATATHRGYLRDGFAQTIVRAVKDAEIADHTYHRFQSQFTDIGPTGPRPDPITPGDWQGSHCSTLQQHAECIAGTDSHRQWYMVKRWILQIKLAISPNHNVLTPDLPVLALTRSHQATLRIAIAPHFSNPQGVSQRRVCSDSCTCS